MVMAETDLRPSPDLDSRTRAKHPQNTVSDGRCVGNYRGDTSWQNTNMKELCDQCNDTQQKLFQEKKCAQNNNDVTDHDESTINSQRRCERDKSVICEY